MSNDHSDSSSEPIDRRLLLGAAGLVGIAALGSRGATAGPLNPPAGAVSGTSKPLGEVEPRIAVNATNTPGNGITAFSINAPGSYYLTGVVQSSNPICIYIGASDVTLDLNGYAVLSSHSSGIGIQLVGDRITVRNGSVSAPNQGIGVPSGSPTLTVREVAVASLGTGITNGGPTVLERCTFTQSGTSSGCNGFIVGAESQVIGCTLRLSTANGQFVSRALQAGGNTLIEGCVIVGGGTGVYSTAGGTTVRGCRLSGQTWIAMDVVGVLVEHNLVSISGDQTGGMRCSGSTVIGNRFMGGGSSAQNGVVMATGNNVVGRNCLSNFSGSGSAAIVVVAGDNGGNKVQDNELVNNYRHIDVRAPYNLIVRNAMSFVGGGGNATIVAGNAYGPLVNCNNADLATIAGSTHPQANLVY